VTVTDGDGKRYSVDVNADSSYDAAHLYLTHVRGNLSCGFPIPTTSTEFEVVTGGRINHVQGGRLKKWIENRRSEWKGPKGMLFSQRPINPAHRRYRYNGIAFRQGGRLWLED
jgi:hypothetical protein